MKIKVDVRITDRLNSYDSRDVAVAALEVEAPWDDVKPSAIHREFDDVLDDVVERVKNQLRAEHKRRLAMREETQERDELTSLR